MYEHLESLRPEHGRILSKLLPRAPSDVQALRGLYPSCPDEYLRFLIERGTGAVADDGGHFVFEEQLLSAESEYFRDRQIYERGAKGDVLIFGWESMGTAYGFDTGNRWQIVEVDEYRTVTKLDLSFRRFVEGLLVCYPQIPVRFAGEKWEDGVGRQYGI